MTYVEYANKLGISLNSAQIEILNLIEEYDNENLIISFPRINGRQMLYNLIERKKGYEQGRVDAIDEAIKSIDDEYFDGGYGDYHEVAMIVRMLNQLKEIKT